MKSGVLGQLLTLQGPLDNWSHWSLGSSARVFRGNLSGYVGRAPAVKVMRPDKVDYALPMFQAEVEALKRLHDVPGVMRLLYCGFISATGVLHLPDEKDTQQKADQLAGDLSLYDFEETDQFIAALTEYGKKYQTKMHDPSWVASDVPFLVLKNHLAADNIIKQYGHLYQRGERLPLEKSINILCKFLAILHVAHEKGITYRDHKILHYYWNDPAEEAHIIDWNAAEFMPEERSEATRINYVQDDLIQFVARTLHYILTGQMAPGALALNNTVTELQNQPHKYEPKWTYDDRYVPENLRAVVAKALRGEYGSALALEADLKRCIPSANKLSK